MKKQYLNLTFLISFLVTIPLCSMESTIKYKDPAEQEYFRDVPEKYHAIIKKNLDPYKHSILNWPRRVYHIHAITNQKKYFINNKLPYNPWEYGNGYQIFCRNKCTSFCTGKSNAYDEISCLSLKKGYSNRTQSVQCDVLKKLVQNYKIHLMPKGSMLQDLEELFQLIKEDRDLSNKIVTFKLLYDFKNDEEIKEDFAKGKEIFPKIVIYAASGKDNAQCVLNKIYTAFKHKDGLDITPRNNCRVTSYIYYAQGNGDDKKHNQYKSFFEEPDRIHYKKNITGTEENYYLDLPGNEKIQALNATQ